MPVTHRHRHLHQGVLVPRARAETRPRPVVALADPLVPAPLTRPRWSRRETSAAAEEVRNTRVLHPRNSLAKAETLGKARNWVKAKPQWVKTKVRLKVHSPNGLELRPKEKTNLKETNTKVLRAEKAPNHHSQLDEAMKHSALPHYSVPHSLHFAH